MTDSDAQIYDSPTGWVRKHMDRYLATGGEDGHEWRPGVPTLLLITVGRKTGKHRRTALIYGRNGDDYLVVASQGGASQHPSWYLNLEANPEVEVQVGDERFTARARPATEDEKPDLWKTMTAIWPSYDDYQTRTDRQIPVVILHRD
jgi:deazaflavin-dependent oxidoreductase (nitroreductase family)